MVIGTSNLLIVYIIANGCLLGAVCMVLLKVIVKLREDKLRVIK